MNNNISDKDKKDWENFLSNKESLPNKDSNTSVMKSSKTIHCDLHGYSLDQANIKIKGLINVRFANNSYI